MEGEKGNIHTHVQCSGNSVQVQGKEGCLSRRAVFGNMEEPLGQGWSPPHGSYALYVYQLPEGRRRTWSLFSISL